MSTFRFQDLDSFQGKCASSRRPEEIAVFSFDVQHVCHPLDDRSLRYYYPPFFNVPGTSQNRPIDLSCGFESFVKYDDSINLGLDPLLDTIQAHENETKTRLNVDIMTWRGMMTKILSAPYDNYGEFEMNATRFEDTIYIEESSTMKAAARDQNLQHRPEQSFPLERMTYWGYKFETLATLPKPWAECSREQIENREDEIVNNFAQYCSVVRTSIGHHSIVMGGEVDAIQGCKPDDPDGPIPYVELKTSQTIPNKDTNSARKFERKLCRFWAQSFLLGVPTIIVGFRSHNGFLEHLEEWKTLDIPSYVQRNGMRTWSGNTCINFADSFLDFLKKRLTGEGTWVIIREKGKKEIMVQKVSEQPDREIVSAKFRTHRQSLVHAAN